MLPPLASAFAVSKGKQEQVGKLGSIQIKAEGRKERAELAVELISGLLFPLSIKQRLRTCATLSLLW